MLVLFAVAIVLSAFMLFLVQPMAAKMVLPVLGGAPAVWATCMLFFQAVLLAGYAYAHVLSTRVAPRRQVWVHAVVIGASCAALPIAMPGRLAEPPQGNPTLWLIALLAAMLGAPFFVVSSTGPLLTRWFSRTDDRRAADPYFLYAASNAGSIAGLLAYPFAIEPALTLGGQRVAWSGAYLVLLGLIVACGWAARRRFATAAPTKAAGKVAAPVTGRRRWRWVLLAMAPCSLMLGVTQYISTDLGAFPLLWIIPLLLYLLSFILAFSTRVRAARLGAVLLWVALPACAGLLLQFQVSALLRMSLLLLTVFVASWMCHAMLAEDRPDPTHLTGFFMLVSVGGVVGGAFNAVVAPLIFNAIAEFPYMLALVLLLRPGANPTTPTNPKNHKNSKNPKKSKMEPWARYWAPAVLGGVLAVVAILGADGWLMTTRSVVDVRMQVLAKLGPVAVLIGAVWAWRGSARAAGVLACTLLTVPLLGRYALLLHRERTFFGVYDVLATVDGKGHALFHGTTIHGMQTVGDERRTIPTSYFHPTGPLGDVVRVKFGQGRLDDVAIVGMGAGTIAAFGLEGMRMTFYEIDPAVVRIATDPNLFTYVSDSRAKVSWVVGDGRLMMAGAPAGAFDVIVLDAFSSDSIPVHLLTREAFEQVYISRLAPGGLIAVHISNRYFDLAEPLARVGEETGLAFALRSDLGARTETEMEGKRPSEWVVLARSQDDLRGLLERGEWKVSTTAIQGRVWTDDYVNLLDTMRWRSFLLYR